MTAETQLQLHAAAGSPLAEVLRRGHRAELLPLAETLQVPADSKGLADLAQALDQELRRRGGNRVWMALLGASGVPSYRQVLAAAARRLEVPVGVDVEATELALAQAWVRRAWAGMGEGARAAAWAQLGLEGAPVGEADAMLAKSRAARGHSFPYYVASVAVGVMAIPYAPLVGCAAAFWLSGPSDAALMPAILRVVALRQAVRHRVTVGLVGSPSSGKDAALKALFGVDTGNIDPIAGSTREVAITRLPGEAPTYVVNTPGLGDVVQAVTDEALQVLGLIDVFVYVVNAQGGVQQRERSDFADVRRRGRPVLVVLNKVDTLQEPDRERLVADTRAKLGGEVLVLPAAFDPLPQLADAPMGLEPIRAWILETLAALGKERDASLFDPA